MQDETNKKNNIEETKENKIDKFVEKNYEDAEVGVDIGSEKGDKAVDIVLPDLEYTSKCKRNECRNEDCINQRRHTSAFCQECSDKYNNEKNI